VYTVEKIAGKKVKRGKVYYYIKWEGYPESQNTWELADDVFCKELVEEFEAQLKSKQQQELSSTRASSPSVLGSGKRGQLTPEIPDLTISHIESPHKQNKRQRADGGKKPTTMVRTLSLFLLLLLLLLLLFCGEEDLSSSPQNAKPELSTKQNKN